MSSQVGRPASSTACKYSRSGIESPEGMDLTIGLTLGAGNFAEVKAAYCHSRNRFMALKVVQKISYQLSYFYEREIKLLRVLSHPRVIAARSIVETEQQVFILMDLAENGDLADYMINLGSNLPEEEAHYVFTQLTEGMQYLHSKSIAHRDIKCDNILFDSQMNVKIADLGSGIDVSHECAYSLCGTRSYAAPEVLGERKQGGYDAIKADCWSMGVTLFNIACGKLAFGAEVTEYCGYLVRFPRDLQLTKHCKDFIRRLLQKNPSSRPGCHEMVNDAWMSSGFSVKPNQIYASTFESVRSSSNLTDDIHVTACEGITGKSRGRTAGVSSSISAVCTTDHHRLPRRDPPPN